MSVSPQSLIWAVRLSAATLPGSKDGGEGRIKGNICTSPPLLHVEIAKVTLKKLILPGLVPGQLI